MSNTDSILPFPLTGKASVCEVPLGTEYVIDHARGQITVRLCQLDLAAGVATPLDKIFIGTTSTGQPDHQVKPCTAQGDRAYGIGMTAEALVDNDYFFVQVDGIMSIHMGDDNTDSVVGQLIAADDDTDTGAGYNTARLAAAQLYTDIGFALEVVTAVDTSVLVSPLRKLLG